MKALIFNLKMAPSVVRFTVLSLATFVAVNVYSIGLSLFEMYQRLLYEGAQYRHQRTELGNVFAIITSEVFFCVGLFGLVIFVVNAYDSAKVMRVVRTLLLVWLACDLVFAFKGYQLGRVENFGMALLGLHALSVALLFRTPKH